GAGYLPLARAGTLGGGAAGNISVNGEYRIVNATGQDVANATLGVARDWAAILTTYRSACGNGVVDPGEQCDDRDAVARDCCSSTGTFRPAAPLRPPPAG